MTAPIFALASFPTVREIEPLVVTINPSSIDAGTQAIEVLGDSYFYNTGDVETQVSGGLEPYTYQWSPVMGNSNTATAISPTSPITDWFIEYTNTGAQTALVRVEVTDSLGNSAIQTLNVSAFIIDASAL